MCTLTHIHTYIHTYIRMHARTEIHAQAQTNTHTHAQTLSVLTFYEMGFSLITLEIPFLTDGLLLCRHIKCRCAGLR